MTRSKWDQRIQRADELAAAHPFAADVLQFYRHIAGFQKALYAYLESSRMEAGNGLESDHQAAGSPPEPLNLPLLAPSFSGFMATIDQVLHHPHGRPAPSQ